MKIKLQGVLLIIILPVITGCSSKADRMEVNPSSQKNENGSIKGSDSIRRVIDKLEAIRLAEEFIIQNGYTDLPPMENKAKLFYESVEGGSTPDEVLRSRQNTLEQKAYGIRQGLRSRTGWREDSGWTVIFRYNKNNSKYRRIIPNFDNYITAYGRAVSMDLNGNNIMVEHEDISLKGVKKID